MSQMLRAAFHFPLRSQRWYWREGAAAACRPWFLRAVLMLILLAGTSGCAVIREFRPAVEVQPRTPGESIALQRGDILTSGRLSAGTQQVLRVTGLDVGACAQPSAACIDAAAIARGLTQEQRFAALAELWLQHAMGIADRGGEVLGDVSVAGQRLAALMESARHAYLYLFLTPRSPGERAFEDRQTQVRDWYNYAVQQASTQMFDAYQRRGASQDPQDVATRAGWTLHVDLSGVRLPGGAALPRELVPASALSFRGLRGVYRRDGFGAELVAVFEGASPQEVVTEPGQRKYRRPAWREMPSPNVTVLFRFPGEDAESVARTREATISAFDPYQHDEITLHGRRVPLAANFTSGYGLWLAQSGFNRQSLRTLFGREDGIDRPQLYVMQPFDPNRRIIMMLHGLASSPEAWVNVANEVLGDDALRAKFQVWLVYYPTNMPIGLNHAAIRRTMDQALAHFDPGRQSPASHALVLIGHSMGGVISRLMVSSADQQLMQATFKNAPTEEVDPQRMMRLRGGLERMLRFDPYPGVSRAIFVASPHRGTPVAGQRLVQWVSSLVRLPLTVLGSFDDAFRGNLSTRTNPDEPSMLSSSIDNLDERNAFVRAAADLPIAAHVRYHSIIGRQQEGENRDSWNDGLVPYMSAHLAGATSEKVILSGHSVQQSPEAILEIRRILHEDLGTP